MQHDLIIWFNTVSNANISSIQELSDGVLVVKLLKTLTLSDTPYNNNPKNMFQKVENFSIAFGIIQKHFSHSCSHDTKKMVNEDEHEIQQFLSVIKVLIGNKETSFNQKISLNPHPNVKRNKRQSFDVPLQTTYKESIKQTESKDNAILKPKIIIPNHQPISISDSSEQTNGESATFSRKSLQEIDEYELKTNNSQYQERRQSIVSHGNPFGLELEKLINKRLSINETNTYGKDKKISTTPSLHRSKTAVIDNNKFTRSPKIETVQKIPSQKKQNKFQIEVTGTNEQFQAVSKNTSTTIEQQKGVKTIKELKKIEHKILPEEKLFKRKSALILLDNRNELQIKQNSIDWQNKDYSYVNISDVITIQKVIQTFYVRKTLKMLRKKIKERKRAIMEILSNEEKFLGLMNQLADFLLFLNEHSTCKTFSLAWSFLKEIIDCTSTLYQSLYIVIVENNKVYGDGIAQCFIQHFIPFECYSHFINMYHRLNNDFEEIILKEELHSNIMEYVHILQIHQQTNMNDLSSAPFQHLMRYHIHLNRIIDSLYQNNPLTKELLQADTIVSDVIFKVDNQHKKYSNSMEINTIIPQLCYPINKTLFGRDLVALKQVEITRVKSRDISKRKYKQKYKKYLAFIITDAIILISNKELATKQVPTLEQLMEFKKIHVEDVIYLDNMVQMTYNSYNLHIQTRNHYIIHFVSTIALFDWVRTIELAKTQVWNNYYSMLLSININQYEQFSIDCNDTSIHSNAILNKNQLIHITLTHVYIFIFKNVSSWLLKEKPLYSINILKYQPQFICDYRNNKYYINFVIPNQEINVYFDTISLTMFWLNFMRKEMHSYLMENKHILPIKVVKTICPHLLYYYELIPSINNNSLCVLCKKKAEYVELDLGCFTCRDCCKKEKMAVPMSNWVEYKELAPKQQYSTMENFSNLLSKGNNVSSPH